MISKHPSSMFKTPKRLAVPRLSQNTLLPEHSKKINLTALTLRCH
jgi:hypothetical protein